MIDGAGVKIIITQERPRRTRFETSSLKKGRDRGFVLMHNRRFK